MLNKLVINQMGNGAVEQQQQQKKTIPTIF